LVLFGLIVLPLHAGSARADEPAGEPVVVPPPVQKPPPPPAPAARVTGEKWGAYFDVTGKGGNKRVLGRGDIFIPLWQNDSTLSFLDLRILGDDDLNIEGNIGLGFRGLVSDNWLVGGYGFFDIKRSDTFAQENVFLGGMAGVEAMSEMLDFRVNGYFPGQKRVRTPELDRAVTNGGAIVISEGYERALSGLDGEAGIRLPFSEDSALWDTRFFVGGYYFDADDVDALAGPRGRFEMRLHDLPILSQGSRLTLEAEVAWDKERDVVAFGGLKLRIPIGGSHSRAGSQLSKLERRMLDPIVRDIDMITRNAPKTKTAYDPKTGEEIVAIRYAAAGATGTGQSRSDPNHLGLLVLEGEDDENGALEDLRDLTSGLGYGAGVAVALNSGGAFEENVDLFDNQILVGGGGTVWVKGSGTRLLAWTAPGSRPTLWGDDNDRIVELASNNTLSGLDFDLSNMTGYAGIYGDNPGDATVMNSRFFGDSYGHAGIEIVSHDDETRLSVTDSLFADIDYDDSAGIYFGGDGSAYIAGNVFLGNDVGIYVENWGGAMTYTRIENNYFEGQDDEGVNFDVRDDSFLRAEVVGNMFYANGNGADLDVDVVVDDNVVDLDVVLDVVGNAFVMNFEEGLRLALHTDSTDAGELNVAMTTNVRNNLFQENGDEGFRGLGMHLDFQLGDDAVETVGVGGEPGVKWDADISGNAFLGNIGDGAYLEFYADVEADGQQDVDADWSFDGNLFQGNTDDGIAFDMEIENDVPSNSYTTALHLTGNTFAGNGGEGYDVGLWTAAESDSVNRFVSFVRDNHFIDQGGDSIHIESDFSNWDPDIRLSNNRISGGSDGIDIQLQTPNNIGRLTFSDNRISNVGDIGIRLDVDGQEFIDPQPTAEGNVVTGSGEDGPHCEDGAGNGQCDFDFSSGNTGTIRVSGVDETVP
jgi:hypothetical protein